MFLLLVLQPHSDDHPEEPGRPLQAAGQVRGGRDPGGSCHALQKAGVVSMTNNAGLLAAVNTSLSLSVLKLQGFNTKGRLRINSR